MDKIFMLDHLNNMLGISLIPGHQSRGVMTQQSATDIFSHYNLIWSIYYPEEKKIMKVRERTIFIKFPKVKEDNIKLPVTSQYLSQIFRLVNKNFFLGSTKGKRVIFVW